MFTLLRYLIIFLILIALLNAFSDKKDETLVQEIPQALEKSLDARIDNQKKEFSVSSKYFDMNVRLPSEEEVRSAIEKGKVIMKNFSKELSESTQRR